MSDSKKSLQPRRVTLELVARGDRELWILDGADGDWSLPMFVDWKVEKATNAEYGMLYPAISPYPIQHLSMKARLQDHTIIDSEERWLLPKEVCRRLLRKAAGVTPRYYYRWPDPNFHPIPVSPPMRIDKDLGNVAGGWEFEDFMKHISERYSLPMAMVRIFWRAICAEAPHWMMGSGRALDMGFCKLVALPFRVNWKEIVRCKLRKFKLAGIFNLPNRQRREALDEIKMPEILCSPHNIGLNRQYYQGGNARLCYTIEAIPTDRFEAAASICEARRLTCGSKSYVANFEKTVESQYDLILAALANYIRKATLPFARVSESRDSGNLRFLQTKQPEKLSGVDPRHIPVSIVAPNTAFSVLGEEGEHRLVSRTAPKLPQVPVVPPPTEDVRGSNGGESGWVPLLYASKISPPGEPVLPSSEAQTGDAPGLAGGTERAEPNEELNEHGNNGTICTTGATGGYSGFTSTPEPIRSPEAETPAGLGGRQADGAVGPEGHQGQDPRPPAAG